MQAHDRMLPDWFNRIRSRQITLPRFQRFESWGHGQVSELLTTVLRGLPSGATLTLEVGDEEKFESRTMVDAPTSGERVTEQLLDGQQRLTALWRSLHNKYPDRTYLIWFEEDLFDEDVKLPCVYGQARWHNNDKLFPLWVDDPRKCWQRDCIPISLLRPDDISDEINEWISMAIPDDVEDRHKAHLDLLRVINGLRTKAREFNLPYLALPPKTPKEVALDVFIKMNTSSVKLTTYDIIVALVEGETGKSLHEHVEALNEAVIRAAEYSELPRLVLDVVALRQDRIPSQAGYRGINYIKMTDEWETVIKGIEWMVQFLEEESIFDAQRLPSYTVIPIIAALWEHLPTQPDQLGNARHLLRKFLWRGFLTSRYEQSSTSNALQDFRGLKKMLRDGGGEEVVPILNVDFYPLPTPEMVSQAEWPKRPTILGRGLLALQIKCGADDLADGAPASVATITSKERPREYHHLFPASTLEDAEIPREQIFRALNCSLITWRTNRTISNKDPITYLKERSDYGTLGEEELRRRLKTHLIPYNKLAVGYNGLGDEERRARVNTDYNAFLSARAKLLADAARRVCEGKTLDLNELFHTWD